MPRRPTGRPTGRPPYPEPLTPAEQRVLAELRSGATNAQIAAALGLSPETVKYHVANMLSKLDLPDRGALAAWEASVAPPARDRGVLAILVRVAAASVLAVTVAGLLVLAIRAYRGGDEQTIAHPTGANDVILRLENGPPSVYPYPLTATDMVLYGDGLLLYEATRIPGGSSSEWQAVRLSENGIQRLLRRAIVEGAMLSQPVFHTEGACADCGPGTITVAANGQTISSSASYAADGARRRATGLRRQFLDLEAELRSLTAASFPADEVLESAPYEPDAIWFVSFPATPGVSAEKPWPAGLSPLITGEGSSPGEGRVLCGAEARAARDYLSASSGTAVSPDGEAFSPAFRPLFPDEPGMAACGL